jgi:hypothetical protein
VVQDKPDLCKNTLLPSSESERNPSKKLAEAGGKLSHLLWPDSCLAYYSTLLPLLELHSVTTQQSDRFLQMLILVARDQYIL